MSLVCLARANFIAADFLLVAVFIEQINHHQHRRYHYPLVAARTA